MNTSDLISIGSRPLLPQADSTYKKESKESLLIKLSANFDTAPQQVVSRFETYQYEFPGDRTYERYLANRQQAGS